MKPDRYRYADIMLQVNPSMYIRLLVLLFLYLYQVFYFVGAIIYTLRYSSFLCLDVFMRYIHSCFISIHTLYLIMCCTCLYDSCATHKLLIYFTNICIDTFILYLLQVIYQLNGITPSLCFCFSPHVSITRHYVPSSISSLIYVLHIRPHTPQLVSSSRHISSQIFSSLLRRYKLMGIRHPTPIQLLAL